MTSTIREGLQKDPSIETIVESEETGNGVDTVTCDVI